MALANQNLLGGNHPRSTAQKKEEKSGYFLFAIIILVVMLGGYFGLAYFNGQVESDIKDIETRMAALERDRNRALENQILSFEKQLGTVSRLLDEHVIWSDELGDFGNMIVPTVQLESLNVAGEEGTYSFGGAADSYTSVARQIASFYSRDFVEDVSVNALSEDNDGRITFEMVVTFDPSMVVLKNKNTNPSDLPQ